MFDAYTKVVSQADARGDFLSNDQLDALGRVTGDGLKRRLRPARALLSP